MCRCTDWTGLRLHRNPAMSVRPACPAQAAGDRAIDRAALAAQLAAELRGYDWDDDDDTSWARGAETLRPGESSPWHCRWGMNLSQMWAVSYTPMATAGGHGSTDICVSPIIQRMGLTDARLYHMDRSSAGRPVALPARDAKKRTRG